MGYKTKAEKRAYKDGLFAGLFGKKRKRKRRKTSSVKKRSSLHSKNATKKVVGKRARAQKVSIDESSRLWNGSLADAYRNLHDMCSDAEIREAAKDVYRSAQKDERYAEYLYDEYGGY